MAKTTGSVYKGFFIFLGWELLGYWIECLPMEIHVQGLKSKSLSLYQTKSIKEAIQHPTLPLRAPGQGSSCTKENVYGSNVLDSTREEPFLHVG